MRNNKIRYFTKLISFLLCFQLILTVAPLTAFAAGSNQDKTASGEIQRKLSLSYTMKGDETQYPLEAGGQLPDITQVERLSAAYSFRLIDHEADGLPNRQVHSGDFYYITLPELVLPTIEYGKEIPIYHNQQDQEIVANYSFEKTSSGTRVKVTFADFIEKEEEFEISGLFRFDFVIDWEQIEEGAQKELIFPVDSENQLIIQVNRPEKPQTTPTAIQKKAASYNKATGELTWKVTLPDNTQNWAGYTLTDQVDINTMELIAVLHGTQELAAGTDYIYDTTTGFLTYQIPAQRGDIREISIKTRVNSQLYYNNDKTIITNTATLSGDGLEKELTAQATQEIAPNWISKKGSRLEGNRIRWTITVNANRKWMYNGIMTDLLDASLLLETASIIVKVNGTTKNYPIFVSEQVPAETQANGHYFTYDPVEGGNRLRFYFPRGAENATNAQYVFQFDTDVDPSFGIANQKPTYRNDASLTTEFLSGGMGTVSGTVDIPSIGTVGVAIPRLDISKNAKSFEPSTGIITWKIMVVSNVTEYGKAVLTEILPADQELLKDEIYLADSAGNPLAKITETSDTARLTAYTANRFTVEFPGPAALNTQRFLVVKSKIKTEEYGQNLKNRQFSNRAEIDLYNTGNSGIVFHNGYTAYTKVNNSVLAKTSNPWSAADTAVIQSNPAVRFTLTLNQNKMVLTDTVVTDDMTQITTAFQAQGDTAARPLDTVVWTLLPGSLRVERIGTQTDSFDLSTVQISYDKTANVFTVTFPGTIHDTYKISYAAEMDVTQAAENQPLSDALNQNGSFHVNGNTASIEATGLKPGGQTVTNTTGQTIENCVLGKTGDFSPEDQQITWSLRINQRQFAITDTRLIDYLPKGLTLDPTSIRLYQKVLKPDGSFLSDEQLNTAENLGEPDYSLTLINEGGHAGQYKLEIRLPDDHTAYIVRFATDIDTSVIPPDQNTVVTNKAFYAGLGDKDGASSESAVTVYLNSSATSVTRGIATVIKTDAESGTPIQGTEFTLYWYREGSLANREVVRTLSSGLDGKVLFRGLKAGETYGIAETKAAAGYLLDDPTPRIFKVEKDADGKVIPLSAQAFANSPIKTGSWLPSGVKYLDGKEQIHQFQFEIKNSSGTTVMTGHTAEDNLNDGGRAILFTPAAGQNPFQYTNGYRFADNAPEGTEHVVATQTYTMQEIPSDTFSSAYLFDTSVKEFTVTVVNQKGNPSLQIRVTDSTGNPFNPVFVNHFRAQGDLVLTAEKQLDGRLLEAGQFTFALYEEGQDVPVSTAVNDKDGKIQFPALHFTQEDVGTKTYLIREMIPTVPMDGYAYDASVYTVTVTIAENDSPELQIKAVFALNGKEVKNPLFINSYRTDAVSTAISGQKTVTGATLKEGQFQFGLRQVDQSGVPVGDAQFVTNDNEGYFAFPAQTYTQADIEQTFYYQIWEANNGLPGYQYDATVYTVAVTVQDQGNGTLRTVTAILSPEKEDAIHFHNSYTAGGTITLFAEKQLLGGILKDGQFQFSLQEKEGALSLIATNDKDGNILFPTIHYTLADVGVHTYTLSEIKGSGSSYSYDASVYSITVTVRDNKDGTLAIETETTVTKNGQTLPAAQMLFVNRVLIVEGMIDETDGIQTVPQQPTNMETAIPATGDRTISLWGAWVLLLTSAAALVLLHKKKTAGETH